MQDSCEEGLLPFPEYAGARLPDGRLFLFNKKSWSTSGMIVVFNDMGVSNHL